MTTLAEVYKRAGELVRERGFAAEYSYRKGAPVDLLHALGVAQRDVGYSARERDPVELLGLWMGTTLTHASRSYEAPQAIALFGWASRNVEEMLTGDPADSPVRQETPERVCERCGADLPGGRAKVCGECKAVAA